MGCAVWSMLPWAAGSSFAEVMQTRGNTKAIAIKMIATCRAAKLLIAFNMRKVC
jgi:hypothetical protein